MNGLVLFLNLLAFFTNHVNHVDNVNNFEHDDHVETINLAGIVYFSNWGLPRHESNDKSNSVTGCPEKNAPQFLLNFSD